MQGGGPRGGTRGACAERLLLSRGRTPLSHLPDKHHENSAAHTVIAAPAAGRVSTSPFPRGESESESEISPPPSSLRPPPAAAPAAPARDALRGRPTARRPRPCGRPPLPRSPFPVPAASPPRALRPRQPLLAARREPAPPPAPWPRRRSRRRAGRGAAREPRSPRGAARRAGGTGGGPGARGRARWRGRPCHLAGTRGDGAASEPRAGGRCQAGLRAGVCPGAPAGESARPRSAEGSRSRGVVVRGGRFRGSGPPPPPPVWCGPSEVRPRMPVPPAPCEQLGDAAFTRGWVFTEDLSAPGRAAHTCGRLRTETLPGFGSVRPEWLLAARSELPVPPRKALPGPAALVRRRPGRVAGGRGRPLVGHTCDWRFTGDGSEPGGGQVVLRKRGSRRSESRSPGPSRFSPWDRPGVQTPGGSRNPQTARETSSFCRFGSHFLLVSR